MSSYWIFLVCFLGTGVCIHCHFLSFVNSMHLDLNMVWCPPKRDSLLFITAWNMNKRFNVSMPDLWVTLGSILCQQNYSWPKENLPYSSCIQLFFLSRIDRGFGWPQKGTAWAIEAGKSKEADTFLLLLESWRRPPPPSSQLTQSKWPLPILPSSLSSLCAAGWGLPI